MIVNSHGRSQFLLSIYCFRFRSSFQCQKSEVRLMFSHWRFPIQIFYWTFHNFWKYYDHESGGAISVIFYDCSTQARLVIWNENQIETLVRCKIRENTVSIDWSDWVDWLTQIVHLITSKIDIRNICCAASLVVCFTPVDLDLNIVMISLSRTTPACSLLPSHLTHSSSPTGPTGGE